MYTEEDELAYSRTLGCVISWKSHMASDFPNTFLLMLHRDQNYTWLWLVFILKSYQVTCWQLDAPLWPKPIQSISLQIASKVCFFPSSSSFLLVFCCSSGISTKEWLSHRPQPPTAALKLFLFQMANCWRVVPQRTELPGGRLSQHREEKLDSREDFDPGAWSETSTSRVVTLGKIEELLGFPARTEDRVWISSSEQKQGHVLKYFCFFFPPSHGFALLM